MISKIHGVLDSVEGNSAFIVVPYGLTYEVHVPAFVAMRLPVSVGEEVTLHTYHYLEGTGQGTSFIPRLTGFLTRQDLEFFELYTTVKGIGARKALRSMTMASGQIAGAIADRDTKTLQSLPEIGRRMSETIVATLHGKVDRFVSSAVYGSDSPAANEESSPSPSRRTAHEVLEVLLQLGESRTQAIAWIDQALVEQPDMDADALLAAVLALKG